MKVQLRAVSSQNTSELELSYLKTDECAESPFRQLMLPRAMMPGPVHWVCYKVTPNGLSVKLFKQNGTFTRKMYSSARNGSVLFIEWWKHQQNFSGVLVTSKRSRFCSTSISVSGKLSLVVNVSGKSCFCLLNFKYFISTENLLSSGH